MSIPSFTLLNSLTTQNITHLSQQFFQVSPKVCHTTSPSKVPSASIFPRWTWVSACYGSVSICRPVSSTHGISSAKRNLILCLIEHIKHITVTVTHIICHVMLACLFYVIVWHLFTAYIWARFLLTSLRSSSLLRSRSGRACDYYSEQFCARTTRTNRSEVKPNLGVAHDQQNKNNT